MTNCDYDTAGTYYGQCKDCACSTCKMAEEALSFCSCCLLETTDKLIEHMRPEYQDGKIIGCHHFYAVFDETSCWEAKDELSNES